MIASSIGKVSSGLGDFKMTPKKKGMKEIRSMALYLHELACQKEHSPRQLGNASKRFRKLVDLLRRHEELLQGVEWLVYPRPGVWGGGIAGQKSPEAVFEYRRALISLGPNRVGSVRVEPAQTLKELLSMGQRQWVTPRVGRYRIDLSRLCDECLARKRARRSFSDSIERMRMRWSIGLNKNMDCLLIGLNPLRQEGQQ